jgi:ParB-like nuclease domain
MEPPLIDSVALMPKLDIKKIKVRNRFRKRLGDIGSLAESIKEVGLLHPIVVRPDGRFDRGGAPTGSVQAARLEGGAGDLRGLSDDLALKLSEGQQHVQRQSPHAGGGVELLGYRHE